MVLLKHGWGTTLCPVRVQSSELHGQQSRVILQDTFAASLWVAAVLCLVRAGGIYGGCWLGCWMGATPVDHRKHMWYSMITQVTLSVHLIKHADQTWPPSGLLSC